MWSLRDDINDQNCAPKTCCLAGYKTPGIYPSHGTRYPSPALKMSAANDLQIKPRNSAKFG